MSNTRHQASKLYQEKHLNTLIISDVTEIVPTSEYRSAELHELRDQLNETKSRLDKYYERSRVDPVFARKWMNIQSAVDLYKNMRMFIQKKYNAQIVTNAWMKYYEIYSHYKIFGGSSDDSSNVIRAFFNAELPGAALCAFNHYMKTIIKTPYEWVASSLVPDSIANAATNSTALGDTYGIFEKNREHWLMTSTNNGDATIIDNLLDWESRLNHSIDIYSHDAGIDVSDDFNNQEIANAKLHLGCALAGFMTLAPKGIFIAKQYTFFETLTWNLILIYASMFDKFYMCKPLTSRPFNSEIYLIGVGFNGIADDTKGKLMDKLANFNLAPVISIRIITSLYVGAEEELLKFAKTVYEQQIRFIDENITLATKYIERSHLLMSNLDNLRIMLRDKWLDTYPVKKINKLGYIPSKYP